MYEFEVNNFNDSLELLSKISLDELYMKFDVKVLQIMIYYETNSIEALISSMEAFRHFLVNNKLLPENKKETYTNFHKYLNKLILLNNKKDLNELERMRSVISGDIKIVNKEWIIKKMNVLLKIKFPV
ncbi:MAG: hypothetical protein IPL53_19615 [Ignavibacteria bacterium]|nr:hypothetical protein [Ignavibacteria bacterium]